MLGPGVSWFELPEGNSPCPQNNNDDGNDNDDDVNGYNLTEEDYNR